MNEQRAGDTNPRDESAENTGKSEQWRSTRVRLALIEEHLERRSEENDIDPCKQRPRFSARTRGGRVGWGKSVIVWEAYRRRMTPRRARRAQRGRSRWPFPRTAFLGGEDVGVGGGFL